MLDDKDLKKILIKEKILTNDEFAKFLKEAVKKEKPLVDYLVENKIVVEETAYDALAKFYKLPFLTFKDEIIRKDILEIIPEPIASAHMIVAFDKTESELKIACVDPDDMETFEFLEKKTNLKARPHITTPSSIKELLKQYHKGLEEEFEQISKKEKEAEETGDADKLKKMAEDLPIIKIVDTLLEYAIFENASDIHIEPQDNELEVRYRIDGVLREVMKLPQKSAVGIMARIKILANLKLDEHRLPQDGRFKIETTEYKISFRVSIIPVFNGEKVVMRLLNESSQILSLEQLGFQEETLDIIKRNIKKPHGMILVTGPTGSGKTTTLYTVLNILNKPGVNITTIEDPIEYHMPRINQSQVNPKIGYTFASGLRAFLRQDPNVIMVGEIRDNETADIAVNAAMTGHLVLSTLHTNDAATALPRLSDMKIEPFLIASTTNIIVAQRLVRKICKNCIVSYNLTKEMEKEIEKNFNIDELKNMMEKEGVIKSAKNSLTSELFFKGKGCKQCDNSGYKGRMGIYEVLEINSEIGEMILKKASADEINEKAKSKGMITIAQDGFIKAKQGITTLEEVIRVTKE
jgi:type IV pilus assembly protein PilB